MWNIEAQYAINLLKTNTDDDDIKTLIGFFNPIEYQSEGNEKIKSRIFATVTTWNNNEGKGIQKIADAINFLKKNSKKQDTLVTNLLDDLIRIFISEVNKKNFLKNARTAKRCILNYTPLI